MSGIVLTLPIVNGKVEAGRRFCQEMSGSRCQMYEASRPRLGITCERLALVETAAGSVGMTTLEAPNVGEALGQIMASELPFDRWYREQVQELHGVTLDGYEHFSELLRAPSAQKEELLFEWTLPSSAGQ